MAEVPFHRVAELRLGRNGEDGRHVNAGAGELGAQRLGVEVRLGRRVVGRRTLDLRCTSLLTQRELTPTQLALLSGMPLSVIGSFLNVVAYRLPLRIEQDFRNACRDSFGAPAPIAGEQPISLLRPGSHCPACKAPVKPQHNLPVFGWLLLRGRCASCHAPISVQYPIVEAITGLMSAVCAQHFGATPELIGALVLTWSLIALTGVVTAIALRDGSAPMTAVLRCSR